LAVKLANRPGELAKLAGKFSRAKVNIEYAYGSSDGSGATLFFRVSDLKRAAEVLSPKKTRTKKAAR
jgi:hypothetical protein